MTFKHIIITRFSVPNTEWKLKIDNNDLYLQNRLTLFERFCLPSIQAQSSHEFIWIVLFGIDTPEWFRAHIREWEKENIMVPIYSPNWTDSIQSMKNWIYTNIQPVDFIITTRLDNDDSLAVNYVRKVQECMPDAVKCFNKWKDQKCLLKYYYVEPNHGQQVDARSNNPREWKFYTLKSKANPFMSMIEPFSDKILTVLWKMHTELLASHESYVKQINGIMWMQVIHTGNISNQISCKKTTSPDLHAFPWLSRHPVIDTRNRHYLIKKLSQILRKMTII